MGAGAYFSRNRSVTVAKSLRSSSVKDENQVLAAPRISNANRARLAACGSCLKATYREKYDNQSVAFSVCLPENGTGDKDGSLMSADADVTEVDDVDALLEELAVDMNGGLADAMVIFGLTSNGGR